MPEIINELRELDELIREATARREQLRQQFFNVATLKIKEEGSPPLCRRVVLPDGWFERCGLTEDAFLESRFPTWRLIQRQERAGEIVFTLEKDPDYLSWGVVHGDLRLAREIQEYNPTIDWDALKKDDPDLFEVLAQPKVVYELDDEATDAVLRERPEVLEILSRHLISRPPARKLSPLRSVKNGRS